MWYRIHTEAEHYRVQTQERFKNSAFNVASMYFVDEAFETSKVPCMVNAQHHQDQVRREENGLRLTVMKLSQFKRALPWKIVKVTRRLPSVYCQYQQFSLYCFDFSSHLNQLCPSTNLISKICPQNNKVIHVIFVVEGNSTKISISPESARITGSFSDI